MTAQVLPLSPRLRERARLDSLLAQLGASQERCLVERVQRREAMRAQVRRQVARWRRRQALRRAAGCLLWPAHTAALWAVAALAWACTTAARWRAR